MKRLAHLLPALFALAPLAARGEATISGSANGGVEHTSNVYSVNEDAELTPDEILFVTPALEAALKTRGVALSLGYTLNYYHYQTEKNLDRALHQLDAKAGIVWWDDIDLEAYGRLAPKPRTYARPIDDPLNQSQQAVAGGRFALRHDFGASTRGSVGYRGEQVTWLESVKADKGNLPPEYVVHGPEASVERDVGRRLVVGLDYKYKMQTYSKNDAGFAPTNYTAHTVTGRFGLDATDWLSTSVAYGFSQVDYEDADPATRGLLDARLVAGGEVARVSASVRQNATQDVLGKPATVRAARLGADYTPYAPWGAGVAANYGELVYDDVIKAVDPSPQKFVMGEGSLFYKISVGVLELSASHHESIPEGSDPKVVVNRATFRLGGRF